MRNPRYPKEHAKLCSVCRNKLFFMLKDSQYYCKLCQTYLSIIGGDGRKTGNVHGNPIITKEQIAAIKRTITNKAPVKVIYKLVSRPRKESQNENS